MKNIQHLTSILALLLSFSAHAESGWWFSAGASYRGGISYSLEGTSRLQEEGRSGVNIGVASPLSDVGSSSSPSNRVYDDGFVRIDPETANSRALITPNLTTHWGYQNNSQLSGRNLTFSKSGPQGLRRLGEEARTLSESETVGAPGVELTVGRKLRVQEENRWDLTAGLRVFIPGSQTVSGISRTEDLRGQVVQIVDTYRLDDIETTGPTVTPKIPSAPFSGSPGSQITEQAIPNIPASRSTRVLATGDWQADTQVEADVDAMLYEVRFGALWSRPAGENWALTLQPSLSAHIVDVDIRRRESVVARYADGSRETLFSTTENASSTEVLFGAGLQAGLSRTLNNRWDVDLSIGYDYVNEASVSVGPNTVKMDFSGYTAGITFRRAIGGNAE